MPKHKIGYKALLQRRMMERRQREADGGVVKRPEPKQRHTQQTRERVSKFVHEVVMDELDDRVTQNESRIAIVDATIDAIIDMCLNELEPALAILISDADPKDIDTLREVKATLDEGVYVYLNEVADLIDTLVET